MKREPQPPLKPTSSLQPISLDVLKEKYLKPGEDGIEDLYRRVARALASVEKEDVRAEWEQRFLDNLHAGAIGAGRIMSAAGTDIQATLINCFVQPVGDAIQGVDAEGYPGIYEALREAAETMRRGGGVGYDFSRIRPKGAEVKGTHSMASGPCSYINVFDQSCSTVESAGARRGAQMGVLRIDHPDVMEFITAKRTPGRWNNFNVSVGVSDAFMEAVGGDQPWELVHKARPGKTLMDKGAYQRSDGMWVYQTLSATELWDTIMKSAYDFAEPGILFLDRIQQDNNLHYCESIEATNPCGEQPLPPYGCCDLGPVILPRFVRHPFGFGGLPSFDFEAFEQVVATQVRALDNVLDRLVDRRVRRLHQLGVPVGVERPVHRVSEHLAHVGVVIGRVGFVAGAEVEDVAGAATIGQARAEHFATLEPGDEHRLERLGHGEGLAIPLFVCELEVRRQVLGDGMAGIDHPDALALAGFAPVQVGRRAHQALEHLGMVARMQHDQAHALPHAFDHALDDGIIDILVGRMAPPEQHVGLVQLGFGQAVLGILQRDGRGDNIAVFGQQLGNLPVHADRIVLGNEGVLLFVDVFAPDGDADAHALPFHLFINIPGVPGAGPRSGAQPQNYAAFHAPASSRN